MRLFRGHGGHGHGGGGGGGLFHLRGSKSQRCDESIGSAIDTKDQFDINVPVAPQRSNSIPLQKWRFVERTDTAVSSITTEDVRGGGYNPYQERNPSNSPKSQSSSWSCCCSGTSHPADPCNDTADNTLLHSSAKPQREEPEPTTGWMCCDGGGAPEELGGPQCKISKPSGFPEINRNNSLFDPLSDDEDGPEMPPQHRVKMKLLQQKVRQALPWKKRTGGNGGKQQNNAITTSSPVYVRAQHE